jgi:hypothetical protein
MRCLVTKQIVALTAVAVIVALCTSSAQAVDANDPNNDSLFDPNRVFTFNFTVDPCDWVDMVAECNNGQCIPDANCDHYYWQATLTCGDLGPMLVGLRRKNDLAEPNELNPQKVSLKLDINYYVPGQLFAGKKKLSLENGSEMATVSEALSWNIYRRLGIVSGRSAWCKVYVNGDYKGVYSNVEQVDKRYLADHGLDGISNTGFLYKEHEFCGEVQRTREAETNPFAFNWYPFDHPIDACYPEIPTPNDWLDQAQWRVDIPHLLTLAAAENFLGNTDGTVQKETNYWYYDWSTEPNDDPNGQQPRLYLPWDLDTTLRDSEIDREIIDQQDSFASHIWQGLIKEVDENDVPLGYPTFQADYLTTYQNLLDGELELTGVLDMVNNLETVIAAEMDLDPHSQLIADVNADEEFQRIRDYLTDRTTYITAQLDALAPLPGTVLLDDGFEGTTWDANWTGAWTDETTRVRTGSHAAGADRGGGAGYFTSDALDASDANGIYLRFYFQQKMAATLTVEYYGSAGWSTPVDLTALGGDSEWLLYADTITDANYFDPNFAIRFNAAFSGGGTRSVEVDDVEINKTVSVVVLPLISGTILDPGAAPVAGVSVDADGGGGSDTTDPNGEYSLTVNYDWSGTVTPTKTDYTFAPADRVYANVTSNQSAQDYTGTDICDLYPDGIFDLRDIDVVCENWLTAGPSGDINGSSLVDLVDLALVADKF